MKENDIIIDEIDTRTQYKLGNFTYTNLGITHDDAWGWFGKDGNNSAVKQAKDINEKFSYLMTFIFADRIKKDTQIFVMTKEQAEYIDKVLSTDKRAAELITRMLKYFNNTSFNRDFPPVALKQMLFPGLLTEKERKNVNANKIEKLRDYIENALNKMENDYIKTFGNEAKAKLDELFKDVDKANESIVGDIYDIHPDLKKKEEIKDLNKVDDNKIVIQEDDIEERILVSRKNLKEVFRPMESKEERARRELDKEYNYIVSSKREDYNEAYNAQQSDYDKVMYLALLGARDMVAGVVEFIDIDTLRKHNLPGTRERIEYEWTEKFIQDKMTELFNSKKTLEEYKSLWQIVAMFQTKACYDVGLQHKDIDEYLIAKGVDAEKRKAMAIALTHESGCFGVHLFDSIVHNISKTLKNDPIYGTVRRLILDKIKIDDNASVSDIMDRMELDDKQRADFLALVKAKPEDIVGIKFKDNYVDFEYACINYVTNGWFREANGKFENSLGSEAKKTLKTGSDIAYGIEINDESAVDDKNDIVNIARPNLIKNIKMYSRNLTSKKPLGIIGNKCISELFNNDKEFTANVGKVYGVSYAIDQLKNHMPEDGKGHKNSKEYNRMLKAMEDYTKAVYKMSGGEAIMYKREMVESIIAYIKGKKSVRRSDYGNQRFDIAMTVLSEHLDKQSFKHIVDRVNEVRSAGVRSLKSIANQKLVTIGGYKDEFAKGAETFKAEYAEMQYETDVDYIVANDQDDIAKIDEIVNRFGGAEGIGHIGFAPFAKEAQKGLSPKDFTAIALAASIYGKADAISDEEAKNKAMEALNKYHNGDKAMLADMLAAGIKHLNNEAKLTDELDSEHFVVNGEYAYRMYHMLERDKELKKFALGSGINAADINYAGSMKKTGEIYIKGKKALSTIKSYNALSDPLPEAERLELITDIVLVKVVNQSIKYSKKKTGESEEYSNVVDKANNEFLKASTDKDRYELDNIDNEEDREYIENHKKLEEIYVDKKNALKDSNVYAFLKYRKEDMIDDIKNSDAVRDKIKNLVTQKGYHKMDMFKLSMSIEGTLGISGLAGFSTETVDNSIVKEIEIDKIVKTAKVTRQM